MRYGRDPDSVRLIAVSKSQPAAAIRTLAELGQREFGENYLQEALPKLAALARPADSRGTSSASCRRTRRVR